MTADIVNFSAYRLRRGLTLPRPADPALVSFYDAVNTVRSPHDANHFRIWRIGIRTLADLAAVTPRWIKKQRECGEGTVQLARDLLNAYGLCFADEAESRKAREAAQEAEA